ncbi:hypothetical protein [Leadbettera azotonutricia]|uniref:Uncharacterized protein n=1 Tax=Leadbettera azotonutricia (strain ATCC BAA-888 / DSM 13862 / ZAS-9) TaxID=545695 RepID=F5YFA0_LEAAZ|nr:hypothetical protein [Leadbettera azotonutricia]AEF83182.1 hypothetical protein TREAZ_1405 [Leadbettera azotonutricia ZAS-9]
MIRDWIPNADKKFLLFSQNFIAQVDEIAPRFNIPAADIADLKGQNDDYFAAWEVYEMANHGPADTTAKNSAKKAFRKNIRDFYNLHIRYNPDLTDADRRNFHATIRSTRHRRIVVGDRRVGFEFTPKGFFMLGLKCWDEETGEKKIIHGMGGVMVFYAISDKPITNNAELNESILITKSNHTFKAAYDQRGKWISATCCWQTKTGERGQVTAIQSALIA